MKDKMKFIIIIEGGCPSLNIPPTTFKIYCDKVKEFEHQKQFYLNGELIATVDKKYHVGRIENDLQS